jgi:hypothetical protein
MLRRVAYAVTLLVMSTALAVAQESPAQWVARIFDPATLSFTPFPGATLNRKFSVDAIALEHGGDKRIAIYLMAPDQLKPAAEHFAKQFGVQPQVTGAESQFETFTFDFTDAKAPVKFKGLRVMISRAQFADNKGQVTMEYQPPKP